MPEDIFDATLLVANFVGIVWFPALVVALIYWGVKKWKKRK